MTLIKALSVSFASAAALAAATPSLAQTAGTVPAGRTPTPTPAPIPATPTPVPTTTIAQALAAQSDHTTLVKLVNAAGLSSALSGPGPITVFAPDDAAFGPLAPGTVDQLLQPANVGSATQILKYHVVQGSYPAAELLKQLKAGGGTLTLNTLDGQPLTLTLQGESAIQLTDALGNKAFVSKLSDVESNGVIEYINGVLSPKMVAQPAPATGAAPATGTDTPAPATDDGAQDDSSDS